MTGPTNNQIDIVIRGVLDNLEESYAKAKSATNDLTTTVESAGRAMATASAGTNKFFSETQSGSTRLIAANRAIRDFREGLDETTHAAEMSHSAISTATREFRALFDEVTAGRWHNVPGTMAIIANRVFGISGMALLATVSVGGLAAAFGFLAFKASEANDAVTRIHLGAEFAGNVDLTRKDIEELSKTIYDLGNITHKETEEIIVAWTRMGGLSKEAIRGLSLATQRYIDETGDKPEQAIEKLKTAIDKETVSFERLKDVFPDLTANQYLAYESAKNLNDENRTVAAILDLVSANAKNTTKDMANLNTGAFASVGNFFKSMFLNMARVGALENDPMQEANAAMTVHAMLAEENEKKLDSGTAAIKNQAAALLQLKTSGEEELESSIRLGQSLGKGFLDQDDEVKRLTADINVWKKSLADNPDASKATVENITQYIGAAQQKIKAITDREAKERAAEARRLGEEEILNTKEKISEINEEEGLGAKEKLDLVEAAWQKILDADKLMADQRKRVQIEMNRAVVAADKQIFDEELVQTKAKISAINADDTISAKRKLDLANQTWAELLADGKFNATEMARIEIELNKTITEAQKAADKEKLTITRNNASTELEIAKIGFRAQEEALQAQVDAKLITEQEKLVQLEAIALAEQKIELDTITKAEDGYDHDLAYYTENENKKKVIKAQTAAEIEKLNAEIARADERDRRDNINKEKLGFEELKAASNSFISNILSGQHSMWDSLSIASREFVKKEIENDANYFMTRLFYSREEMLNDKTLGQQGLLLHMATEQAKVGATVTAETEKVAAKASGAAAGSAIEVASDSASIMNSARVAFANTYAAVAQIPYVGPYIAPIAAAGAFATVAAFDTLTSLDVGAWDVPHDMVAQIHQGEQVIPKKYAEGMRQNGGMAATPGRGGDTHNLHVNYSPNIQHHAPQSLETLLQKDSSYMISWFHARLRDGELKMT